MASSPWSMRSSLLEGLSLLLLPLLSAGTSSHADDALALARCRLLAQSTTLDIACPMAAFGGYVPGPSEDATEDPTTASWPLIIAADAACNPPEQGDQRGESVVDDDGNDGGGRYAGAIVLVRRGGCAFQEKLVHIVTAGGRGMILLNSGDDPLHLGTLDFEPLEAIAVSITQRDGERLLATAAAVIGDHGVAPRIAITTDVSREEQSWQRIRYLLTINAPLVAYETFMSALPPSLVSLDDVLATIQTQQGIDLPPEWLTFLVRCASAFSSQWEFTREAGVHAAAAAAAALIKHPTARQSDRDQVLSNAAGQLAAVGYFAHAAIVLEHSQHPNASCELAFVWFLQAHLDRAIPVAHECVRKGIAGLSFSIPGLEVPLETFLRLASTEMTDADLRCVRDAATFVLDDHALVSDVDIRNGSTCCRRRQIHNRDEVGGDDGASSASAATWRQRRTHAFRSAFLDELFHGLNVMGVFLDELGAFEESLRFLDMAAGLCEDSSLILEMRRALAIPIVYDSLEAINDLERTLRQDLRRLAARHRVTQSLRSSLTGTRLEDVNEFARPEDAPYYQYTITPSTMFIGYQGSDVLELQRSIFALRLGLFPSLTSTYEPPIETKGDDDGLGVSGRRRRIGFVSSWFRNHSVGKLLLGVVERLDRRRFHVAIYRCTHFLPGGDELTAKFREAADSYTELPVNQEDAVMLLRHEALDVMIYPELGMDAWTLLLAHHRLAPVQCVFWGHPVTTGNPSIDYFISSELFISDFFDDDTDTRAADGGSGSPQGHVDKDDAWRGPYHGTGYSEQVVLFRGLSTFFTRPRPFASRAPITRSMLHLPTQRRLYVCPQTLMKLHPAFDDVLGGILTRDPRATIVLLSSSTQLVWKERLRRRLRRRLGLLDHRRVLFSSTLPYREFMALLATADVVLDPFPFGGGVTTLDAFAVGTPVVTLPGRQSVVQLAAGFLRYMGITDTITRSVGEYVDVAVAIARDPARRSALRERILAQRAAIYDDDATLDDWHAFLASVGA